MKPSSVTLCDAYVVRLLWFLHDKLPDHGGAEFHQVREDVCRCCPHLQVIHSLNKSTIGVEERNKASSTE